MKFKRYNNFVRVRDFLFPCFSPEFDNLEETCLIEGSKSYSFRDLVDYANSISYSLKYSGIKQGSRILLYAPKGFESIASILGIINYKCSYIPIDERNGLNEYNLKIIKDCQPDFIITTFPMHVVDLGIPCLNLTSFEAFHVPLCLATRFFYPDLMREAYVLYTSGTAGSPKGVRISLEAVATFFHDIQPYMNANGKSIFLNTSPIYFDVSLIDTLFPLFIGASVVLTPGIFSSEFILNAINKYRCTHMCGVSSTLNRLIVSSSFENLDLSSLRTIMTGAEVLNYHTLYKFFQKSNGLKIINGYGPTECTCVCIAHVITKNNLTQKSTTCIGKPLPNILVDISEEGNLLVSGQQTMLGYVGSDCETDFTIKNGKYYYDTGDVVELDLNNNLYFKGRKDRQVKYRGYRIELQEIEDAINSIRCVANSYVTSLENEQPSLAAVVLKEENQTISEDLIRRNIQEKLATYKIPEKILILDSFPYKKTGKVDTGKLDILLQS